MSRIAFCKCAHSVAEAWRVEQQRDIGVGERFAAVLDTRKMAGAQEFEFVTGVLDACESSFQAGPAASKVIGSNLEGGDTRMRALIESCGAEAKARWLGRGATEEALLAQWMSVKNKVVKSADNVSGVVADLNTYLASNSFLVSSAQPTLADVCLFYAVRAHIKADALSSSPSFCRWFDQMQNWAPVRTALGKDTTPVKFGFPDALSKLPAPTSATQGAPVQQQQGAVTPSIEVKKKKPQQQQQQQQQQAKGAGNKDKQQQQQQQQQGKKENKKDKKKEKKAAAPPAAENDQPEITKLEIRVGKITKCWRHEESDKLFCEEIDVGEDAPRAIGSGLAQFYSGPEDLQGRLCLVLCNLKARKLAGYNSHGMVLCASNADKSKVEVVDPPAGAKVGERVTFDGVEGEFEPFAPNQIAKKKVFEGLVDYLKTDAECHPSWVDADGKYHRFLTSAGPCKVPTIADGNVS